MVRCVNEAASYTKMHIHYNSLIPAKLQYLATFWPWRCTILQLLLYTVQCDNYTCYTTTPTDLNFLSIFHLKSITILYLQSFIPPNNNICDTDCCINYYTQVFPQKHDTFKGYAYKQIFLNLD
jgi:hypothetical protein